MRRLEGKVIIVAGGAGGIGAELSRRYAAEGASVLIGDKDLAGAQTVVETILGAGGMAAAEPLDMTEDESVARLTARCEERFGGVDGMHANAASFKFGQADTDAVAIELEVYEHVMRANAGGYLYCARHAVPAMLRRGGGTVLFTSSGAAHVPDAVRVAYSMSKAAVHALMRHVVVRWGREGIRANVIAPGVVMHERLEKNASQLREWALKRVHMNRLGEPSDIAAMAAMLMSEEGRYVTGQVISIDGGSSMRP